MRSPGDSHTAQSKMVVSELPPLQSYDIAALKADGSHFRATYRAPTFPQIDSAFSAFARGVLLSSPEGLSAIEDRQAGDRLNTRTGAVMKVRWSGSSSYVPSNADRATPLVRITADAFGPGRPAACVTVGPAARILHAPEQVDDEARVQGTLVPARAFVDGVSVFELLPPTPVQLFHICLSKHAIIQVDGVEMETFHPGPRTAQELSQSMRTHFLAMFPHISRFSDFGSVAYPRRDESKGGQSAA